MVIHASGTFDYMAVVPDDAADGLFECPAHTHRDIPNGNGGSRLVGLEPRLVVSQAGIPSETGPGRPWVMRSRLTLAALDHAGATVAEASFYVDRALTRRMLPGDEVYLSYTDCGGLGLSVVRHGELVVAVGDIAAVPLGDTVQARVPSDLLGDASAVFARRDPHFHFPSTPIELTVADETAVVFSGIRSLGPYGVFVAHGQLPGIPGTDCCAAIWRKQLCPETAARATMEMLDTIEDGHPLATMHW
jgi:hypothetical protein